MVGRIDAASRIDVFIPGAANGSVLFQDDEGDAGLLQLDAGIEPRHAGPDDDDLGIVARRGIRRRPPFQAARVQAVAGEVLAHHRDIVVRHRLAGRHRHHLAQQRVVQRPVQRRCARRRFGQHPGEPVANRATERFGHEFLVVHRAADVGLRCLQPVPLAGELHQHQQQRRRIGRVEPAPLRGHPVWRFRSRIRHFRVRPLPRQNFALTREKRNAFVSA